MFGLSYGQVSYGGNIPFEETEKVFPYCPEPSKARYNTNIYSEEEKYTKMNVYEIEAPYTSLVNIYSLGGQYGIIKPYLEQYPYITIIST